MQPHRAGLDLLCPEGQREGDRGGETDLSTAYTAGSICFSCLNTAKQRQAKVTHMTGDITF